VKTGTLPSAIAMCAAAVWAAPPAFEPARVCAICHSNLPSPVDGRTNTAPYALWLGSMKASSAHDPYWKAKVREEALEVPAAAAQIENTCLRCHAPAQQYSSGAGMRFRDLKQQGEEGVTCTVCHQITPAGFGTKASFSGNFRIGAESQIFGPHENPFSMPMLHHTGYQPVESPHVLDAELCATCHTVITPTLDDAGKPAGEFVEQAPYLEWYASAYRDERRTCQSCHTPALGAPAYIAHRPPGGPFPPTSPRTPFGLHFFRGANVRGAEMLAEAMPDRKDPLLEAAARASGMLSGALRLEGDAARTARGLEASVRVQNQTGHKLPTAYPSRRLWLHVAVFDEHGKVLFESGGGDPASGQPHYARITSSSQAIVYEAAYVDVNGAPTTSLMRAARYLKDNRILPRGFDLKTSLPAGIDTAGIASVGTIGDPDFRPGSDRIIYDVALAPAARPARIVVEALYQSIQPAHAQATASRDTDESRRFRQLYERHGDPVIAARLEIPVATAR
jgi:hypothetical protein